MRRASVRVSPHAAAPESDDHRWCWSATGSSNFDDRFFETNDEITLGIRDAATAQRLDAVFVKYAPHCKEIELEAWCKRGLWHKLKDNAFYVLNEIL